MKNLQNIRKLHNLTQKETGKLIGVAEKTYQNYELGVHEPSIEKLIILAKYFNVSIDYLVGLRDEP